MAKRHSNWGGPRANSGGQREGAGRPHADTVQLVIRVKPEVRQAIIDAAKREGKSYGAVVEAFLSQTTSI